MHKRGQLQRLGRGTKVCRAVERDRSPADGRSCFRAVIQERTALAAALLLPVPERQLDCGTTTKWYASGPRRCTHTIVSPQTDETFRCHVAQLHAFRLCHHSPSLRRFQRADLHGPRCRVRSFACTFHVVFAIMTTMRSECAGCFQGTGPSERSVRGMRRPSRPARPGEFQRRILSAVVLIRDGRVVPVRAASTPVAQSRRCTKMTFASVVCANL